VADPTGPARGSYRVVRGGCWLGTAGDCRATLDSGYAPEGRFSSPVFRLALSPSEAEPLEAGSLAEGAPEVDDRRERIGAGVEPGMIGG